MSASQPLVAIVTPVYNGSPWLERTMACVQQQTYGNIVHVLLDNASTDDTPEVIRRFEGGTVPLKVARNSEVLNQTANWNAAMKLVPDDAAYVMLLCADDLIRADAIEKLVSRAEEDRDIVLVTAPDVVFDRVRAPLPPGGRMIVDGKEFVRAFLDNTFNHYAWQLFFVRWTPEQARGDFFSTADSSLDTLKLLALMFTGKLGFVMEPLFYTRHHSANMSAQFTTSYKPNFRLYRWETAIRYAEKLFGPDVARSVIRKEKYFVLRFVMSWYWAGAREQARVLHDRLARDGYPPSWWDYLMAALTYPFYKLHQKKISEQANARWPQTITEADLVGYRP